MKLFELLINNNNKGNVSKPIKCVYMNMFHLNKISFIFWYPENKEVVVSIHLVFPERTIPLGSQMMDTGKYLSNNAFDVKSVKEIMELKHTHTHIYDFRKKGMLNVSLFTHT